MKIVLQLILIVLLVAVAKVGIGQLEKHAPKVPERVEREHVPEVEVRELTRERRDLEVPAQGRVVVPPRLALTPQVSGRVLGFHEDLEEGARIAAGTELVRIDPTDFELALAAARAGAVTAQANATAAEAAVEAARAGVLAAEAAVAGEEVQAEVAIADWRELNEGEAPALVARTPQLEAARGQLAVALGQVEVAGGNLAAARAALTSAEVAIDQAELALARTVVTMPFDGRVVARSVEVGQLVDPMSPLVTVQRDEWPEVRISVPLDQLPHLGLEAGGGGAESILAELEAMDLGPDGRPRTWLAKGRAVAPTLDERNPVVHLLAASAPAVGVASGARPIPGQFLRVRLQGLADQEVVAVPRRALQPDGRVLLAVVDEDGRTSLERRAIVELQRTADEVLVSAGLATGELLILTPPPVVKDGMAITTRAEGAEPTAPAPTEPEAQPKVEASDSEGSALLGS